MEEDAISARLAFTSFHLVCNVSATEEERPKKFAVERQALAVVRPMPTAHGVTTVLQVGPTDCLRQKVCQ